jgi:hypothetical protein
MRSPIKTIITLLICASLNTFAQPVLTANHMPDADSGIKADMYVSTNITNPGGPGANGVWDFSFQSSFDPIGKLEYMGVAGTEFADDFITCNLVARRTVNGDTFYNYYTDLSSEVIINGENMGSSFFFTYPTSNTKVLFQFPMHYQDSFTDTFSSNHGQGYVIREYDGWGTVKTNFYEFNNVVRIKNITHTFAGTTTSYDWYTTDKYIPVVHYEVTGNIMTILKMFPVSVENTVAANTLVTLAPNPFKEQATLYVDNVLPGMKLTITNAIGQVVRQSDVNNNNTVINKDALSSGMYFYQLQSKEGIAAKGKFVIE